MNPDPTFVVTGATGNVGAEVVTALRARGRRVRAVTRHAERIDSSDGIEVVVGDLEEPASLYDAMAGAAGIFLLPGYDGAADVLAHAKQSGVERVVLLSGGSAASGDTSNAVTRYMMSSEAAVRDSGLAWTVIRPCAFMSNTLRWRDQLRSGDVVRLPFAGVRTAMVDPADVAAVAVEALVNDGHAGRIYDPSGPESLLPAEQVSILAAGLQRELRFEAQPDNEARTEMLKNTPPEYVEAFFDFYVAGSLDESKVTNTVQTVTGRPAGTLLEWVRAHAPAFDQH